jgi:GT2 family glycosyltransferase
MVLQPGEEASLRNGSPPSAAGLRRDLEFDYTGPRRREIWNVMAGNLSVRREAAIACGGFDEAFVGVAYRFETEFCRRLRRNGGRVFYEPAAVIRHLKAPSGGTRIWGFHKVSARPEHGVGDYYFAFLEARGRERWAYVGRRFLRETLSRFHRRRPWYIPVKALGEVRAFLWALCLARKRRSRA